MLTGHQEAVLQGREQVRVCFSVDQVLLNLLKHLAGTLGLHMDLKEGSSRRSSSALQHVTLTAQLRRMKPLIGLTTSKRLDTRSSSSFRNISKKSRCLQMHPISTEFSSLTLLQHKWVKLNFSFHQPHLESRLRQQSNNRNCGMS